MNPRTALLALSVSALITTSVHSEELTTTAPEEEFNPFAGLEIREIPDHGLDRTRGRMEFKVDDAKYLTGEHFGRWNWPEFTPDRSGNYMVHLTYVSMTPKVGMQFYVGQAKAKGYAPQSGGMEEEYTLALDDIYIPSTDTHLVGILSGDNTNGPSFQLRGVELKPAPEGEQSSQAIDGSVTLAAGQATTYSTKMRYEPGAEKNCLGFWTEPEDWAEWDLVVHTPGTFKVEVYQGCGGEGNAGSEVAVYINGEKRTFTVEDTGGFQNWKAIDLGTVELVAGDHVVAVKPETKAGKGILDLHKITLTPQG